MVCRMSSRCLVVSRLAFSGRMKGSGSRAHTPAASRNRTIGIPRATENACRTFSEGVSGSPRRYLEIEVLVTRTPLVWAMAWIRRADARCR